MGVFVPYLPNVEGVCRSPKAVTDIAAEFPHFVTMYRPIVKTSACVFLSN